MQMNDRMREVWKIEAQAAQQDRYAAECHAKGEPKYNLHSAMAEQLRRRARCLRLAAKQAENKN